MKSLDELLEYNKVWSARMQDENPDFFRDLVKGQKPTVLWIGCSDSRVPPSVITGAAPGVLFMYRNIANLAIHTDVGFLSALEYAVLVLGIEDIVVAGHYQCGGVHAACSAHIPHEMTDHWIQHIRDIKRMHQNELNSILDKNDRFDRLVELNVLEQVKNIESSSTIRKAGIAGRQVRVHGLVYDTSNGLLKRIH